MRIRLFASQGMLLIVLVSGCTADLEIYKDSAGTQPVKGVPFPVARVYVEEGYLTAHTKGAGCNPQTPYHEYVTLPGDIYFAHAETGWMADSQFGVNYGENGVVSQLSLNSESNAPETISAIGDAVPSIAGALFGARAISGASQPAAGAACDTGKQVKSMVPFECWSPSSWVPAIGATKESGGGFKRSCP